MNLAQTLILALAKFLIGGDIFPRIQHIVQDLVDPELTGDEKREQAKEHMKELGIKLSGFLANLAIELAVAYFKLPQEEEEKR